MGVCSVYTSCGFILFWKGSRVGANKNWSGYCNLWTTYNSDTNSERHEQSERESEDLEAVCLPMTAQIPRALTSSANWACKPFRESRAWDVSVDRQTEAVNWKKEMEEIFHRATQAIVCDLRSAVCSWCCFVKNSTSSRQKPKPLGWCVFLSTNMSCSP